MSEAQDILSREILAVVLGRMSEAQDILSREILAVVLKKLARAGYEIRPEPGGGRQEVWTGGSLLARISAMPIHDSKVAVWVMTMGDSDHAPATFSKRFSLQRTESPSRFAAFAVRFLREEMVKSVHRM